MLMSAEAPGRLVVISGPSGAGKSTVVNRLLDTCSLPLRMSVSATTRPPRPGEVNGRDYFFLSDDQFARLREADAFLECKEVFGRGHWYGTLREQVATGLQAGQWVILEIDVEGAMSVLEREPDAITIFIHPGDADELERRLRARGTESEAAIGRRLAVARRELARLDQYQYEVINRSVDEAVQQICRILQKQKEQTRCSTN